MTDYRISAARNLVLVSCLGLMVSGCVWNILERIGPSVDETPTDCGQAEFVVTMEADAVTGTCNDDCTLRDAVIAANECPGAQVIVLDEGVYTLSVRGSDATEQQTAGSRGDLDIIGDTTIVGVSEESTVITGNRWPYRILEIADGATVALENLTIEGGSVHDEEDLVRPFFGGGIYNEGTLSLRNVTVRLNQAHAGGGIYSVGPLEMSASTVRNNLVPASQSHLTSEGGGIHAAGELTIRGSFVTANSAGRGGGIAFFGPAGLIENTLVEGNRTEPAIGPTVGQGGGILSGGNLEVTGSRVAGNFAARGGGLYLAGSNEIRTTTIDSNGTVGFTPGESNLGGGIFVVSGESSIERSAIVDNESRNAGGLAIEGVVAMVNSTLAYNRAFNSADSFAGGVYLLGDGELDLRFSTSYRNSFEVSEARIDSAPPLRIANNVLIGFCRPGRSPAHFESLGHNIVEIQAARPCRGDWHPTDITTVRDDGLVVPIDDSVLFHVAGGPYVVPVFRLQDDSPAIDVGSAVECPPTDQLGRPRPETPGGECDAGAYEFGADE